MFKLKIDQNGVVAVSPEGHAIYVDEDSNEEVAFDVNELRSKIIDLGRENKKRRETNKGLMERLKVVEDIDDLPTFVEKARSTLETEKKPSEEVVALRQQWAKEKASFEAMLQEKQRIIEKSLIEGKFNGSKFFVGTDAKTLLSPNAAYKLFGDRFKVEAEADAIKLVALDDKGDVLYSKKNPDRVASFDEAIDHYLTDPSYKDLVRFNASPGSGSAAGVASSVDVKASQQALAYQEAVKTGSITGLIKTKLT